MTRPEILVLIPLRTHHVNELRRHYIVHYFPAGPEAVATCGEVAARVRGVVTNGSTGLSASHLAALPNVDIVTCYGAGHEHVDLAAARARGVTVAHAGGTNDATVADHALALMLALARGLVPLDRAVRAGAWRTSRTDRPTLNGRRLGLLGLGAIGLQIARRAAAFDMPIAYHTRRPRPEVQWPHHATLVGLAEASDVLVAACPGGPTTRHMIGTDVLRALGPEGFLVNIARGSVVDTAALLVALEAGTIAGAALDVIEGEPEIPQALLARDNVLLTPHVAGRSPEAAEAQLRACLANLDARFQGRVPPGLVSEG